MNIVGKILGILIASLGLVGCIAMIVLYHNDAGTVAIWTIIAIINIAAIFMLAPTLGES